MGETDRLLRTRFGEHRDAVLANDATQLVTRHFNSGSDVVSDKKLEPFVPFPEATVAVRHEMHLISKP